LRSRCETPRTSRRRSRIRRTTASANVGSKNGGNVTLTDVGGAWQNAADGTLKTGYAITIRRVRPLSQTSDIRNQGGFFADVHEDTFDHLVMIDQQQQDGGGSGQSPFGGGGRQPNSGNGGGTAQTNSGSGGAGAGCGGTPNSGGGGAAGGYVEKLITNPAATYSYAVGGGASGGSAGTSGFTGGAGAAGIIVIEELYD
jgi:hypothetical protein